MEIIYTREQLFLDFTYFVGKKLSEITIVTDEEELFLRTTHGEEEVITPIDAYKNNVFFPSLKEEQEVNFLTFLRNNYAYKKDQIIVGVDLIFKETKQALEILGYTQGQNSVGYELDFSVVHSHLQEKDSFDSKKIGRFQIIKDKEINIFFNFLNSESHYSYGAIKNNHFQN